MAVRNITGNYLICGNEVFVEGKSIGQFQSFESDETRENIVGTASIEMPFYTIAAKAAKEVGRGSAIAVQRVGKNTTTYVRINPDDWNIKTGARIRGPKPLPYPRFCNRCATRPTRRLRSTARTTS